MKSTRDGKTSHMTSLENTAICPASPVSWYIQIKVKIDANGSEMMNAPNKLFRLATSVAATITPPEKRILSKRFCHNMKYP